MSNKMHNLFLLKNMRPKSINPYRKDADQVLAMYERGEIKNIKTAINLISKLASMSSWPPARWPASALINDWLP